MGGALEGTRDCPRCGKTMVLEMEGRAFPTFPVQHGRIWVCLCGHSFAASNWHEPDPDRLRREDTLRRLAEANPE